MNKFTNLIDNGKIAIMKKREKKQARFFALLIVRPTKAENAMRFLSLWYNLNYKMVMRKKKYIYIFLLRTFKRSPRSIRPH